MSRSTDLPPRQVEYLLLFLEGLREKEIAARMRISHKTVTSHKAQLLHRLGLNNAVSLVKWAILNGYTGLAL